VIALADGLCDLGEITSAEGLHDWGRRTEEEHGKPQSGFTAAWSVP
jgi:hypothetical protein